MGLLDTTDYGFGYSAVAMDGLEAPEYTIVSISLDVSGSLAGYEAQLLELKKTIVEACKKSPKNEYLLLRLCEFNGRVQEIHGFIPLAQVDASSYTLQRCSGSTVLYDACVATIGAVNKYAASLSQNDYLVNAINIIITDGDDQGSCSKVKDVANEIKKSISGEKLESCRNILIGVNPQRCSKFLSDFKDEVGFDQYEEIDAITAQKLAKLANFVSKSISAQSISLGTGGASQALTF